MLSSIRIEGFRRFEKMDLSGLGQVNFILGNNNVGKTTILESVYALACGQRVSPLMNIPVSRARYAPLNQNPFWIMEELLAVAHDRRSLPLRMLFEACDDGRTVRFEHRIIPSDILGEYDPSYKTSAVGVASRSGDNAGLSSRPAAIPAPGLVAVNPVLVAKWEVEHDGTIEQTDLTVPYVQVSDRQPYRVAKYVDVLSHVAVSELVNMYASLKREHLLSVVVDEISRVFPEIVGFDMIPYPDGSQAPLSVVARDGSLLPLYAYGDGVQKWFYVLGAMTAFKQAIVCIDEVDVGLHSRAQADFSNSMVKYALRNGVQIFATTHSIEFIDHFLSFVANGRADFGEKVRIITLREIDGDVKVRNLSAAEACEARDSFNLELR